MFFFFFSSRRRHTRCGRDWSSDVCSSDLGRLIFAVERGHGALVIRGERARTSERADQYECDAAHARADIARLQTRSEERRVGKECRSRGWPDHRKKKIQNNNESDDRK